MSKQLIEQLAKEHGLLWASDDGEIFEPARTPDDYKAKLEAFAKAYQAAAPIDNGIAEALEKAAKVCESYKDTEYPEMARDIQDRIRALIPTQADPESDK